MDMKIIFPYPTERVAIFIDGANLAESLSKLGFSVNYDKLLKLFRDNAYVIRAYYYSAIRVDDDGTIKIKPLLDYLAYNNFVVITKPAKVFIYADGAERTKGNMDVEMAVDVMKAAKYANHVVLFTGDGDFLPAVKAVQEQGVRVTVISTYKTSPAFIADELRKGADHYIDLSDLQRDIERDRRTVEGN